MSHSTSTTGRLADKVALVTGGASGIGLAIVETFLKEGAKVVMVDLNTEEGSKIAEKLSASAENRIVFSKCNVTSSSEVDAAVKLAIEKFGTLDILVNNAGIVTPFSILDVTDQEWQRVIDVNLTGVFYGIRAAGRVMRDKNVKGSIINISSILGQLGAPRLASYCASKGGVLNLTKAAATELGPLGIRVNAIQPGYILTNMTAKGLESRPDINQKIMERAVLNRHGDPAEIANAALFLASSDSSFVSGTGLVVDGGYICH